MLRSALRPLAALAIGILAVTSCAPQQAPSGGQNQPSAPQGPAGELNVALVSLGTENWLPRLNNPDEAALWALLMDSPIGTSRTDGFTLDAKEGIAESWDLKLNGQQIEFTVKLRKGVPFHKGEGTVTAKDFKFTIQQLMKEGSVNPGAGEKVKILANNIDNIQIVDDYTLIIKTTTQIARAGLEKEFTLVSGGVYGIMPEAYFNKVGGEEGYRKAPIGTGPYQFVEHRPNEYVRFEAVENHWRKTGAFKTITLRKVPDQATALAQLKSGQIDIVGLTPRQLAEVRNDRNVKVTKVENSGEIFMIFGGMVQPTRPAYDATLPWIQGDLLSANAKKVREALTIAVDKKTIIDRLLLGEARATNVPYLLDVPGSGWHNPNWRTREYNPTRAKQLLAEAGYPNGFSIKSLVFPLPYNPANADVMEAINGYWEAIGVKVERQQVEYRPTARQRLVDRTTAGFIYVYTQPSYDDPYRYLSGSCCFRTDAALNHWEMDFIDKKTDEARLTYDLPKRNAVMKEIGDFLYDNFIGIPIGATNNLWATRTDKVGQWPIAPGNSWIRDLEHITKP